MVLAQLNGAVLGLVESLETYLADLAISEALTNCDPAITQWQRDLYFSNSKIGDVQAVKGASLAEQKAYQRRLKIMEAPMKRDPANTA